MTALSQPGVGLPQPSFLMKESLPPTQFLGPTLILVQTSGEFGCNPLYSAQVPQNTSSALTSCQHYAVFLLDSLTFRFTGPLAASHSPNLLSLQPCTLGPENIPILPSSTCYQQIIAPRGCPKPRAFPQLLYLTVQVHLTPSGPGRALRIRPAALQVTLCLSGQVLI